MLDRNYFHDYFFQKIIQKENKAIIILISIVTLATIFILILFFDTLRDKIIKKKRKTQDWNNRRSKQSETTHNLYPNSTNGLEEKFNWVIPIKRIIYEQHGQGPEYGSQMSTISEEIDDPPEN